MEEMIHAKIILVVVVGFGPLAVGVQSLNIFFGGGGGDMYKGSWNGRPVTDRRLK